MKLQTLATAVALLSAVGVGARDLRVTPTFNHDYWWLAPEHPELIVDVADTLGRQHKAKVRVVVTTDLGAPVSEETIAVALTDTMPSAVTIVPPITAPGFYRAEIFDGDKSAASFNFGFEPERIVSLPDHKPDLREYWDGALAELAAVPLTWTMEEMPDKSGEKRKLYYVEIPTTDADTIRGYLAVPVAPGKYPALVYFNGYGASMWCVDADVRPDWIEFIPCARGQMLSQPHNKYGHWIQYGMGNKDIYYYRYAFQDAVRAVDFLYNLPQTDQANIFARGGSQGGALTLAAAALDHRLTAIAPYVPFLSDYPDYFRINKWPGNEVKKAAAEAGLTDAEMYEMLSYFDIKNLARWIKCPVLMGVGLQDPVCPPHTNFSGYNLITSPKRFVIYPRKGHGVDSDDFNPRVWTFFARYMR